MLTHEQFREQLLDYLYELLDEPQMQAMRAFLESHPAAQAEADRARRLMSAAARVEFSSVRFDAPEETPQIGPAAALSRPAVPAIGAPEPRPARSMSRVVITWIAAVAAVLLIGAIVAPTTQHLFGTLQTRAEYHSALTQRETARSKIDQALAERRAQREKVGRELAEAGEEMQKLHQKQQAELAEADRKARDKQLVMVVTGPQTIQPGAPNQFEISTRNLNGLDTAARLSVRLKTPEGRVLFEEKEALSQGRHRFTLPPDFPYLPGTQLFLEVSAKDEVNPARTEVTESLGWSAPRYVTHLATDKPMYQPGQTLYLRSLTLNRATLQPPEEDFRVTFQIKNPKGAVVWTQSGETRLHYLANDREARTLLGPDQKAVRGIGVAEFSIPAESEGGEYILTATEDSGRFPTEERKFLVNRYTPDRINKELDFTRKSYGPGDEVVALCKATLESGPLVGKPVTAKITVDGAEFPAQPLGRTDAMGNVRIRAVLPKSMSRGVASMTVTFSDGGDIEGITKPIPVVLNKLFVEYYPEGGDLVAGVSNRVYFRVETPSRKPGELKARLVDSTGKIVADDIQTLNDEFEPGANQGMGAFQFTPQANEKYSLQIIEPVGVAAFGEFPKIAPAGVVLKVETGVTASGEPIIVSVQSPDKARDLLVGAYCRGRTLAHQRIKVEPGQPARVQLKPEDDWGGVVRVTVFEERSIHSSRSTFEPKAERLIYRRSTKKLAIRVQPDKSRYAPGDMVSLNVAATDEAGKPARGILLLSVVNQSVVTMADEKTARTMPTHFALVGEVRRPEDLEHADFLFNESHPKAATALDLLLGVQGWRRFAEQRPDEFRNRYAEEADRMLVMTGQSQQREMNTRDAKQQEIMDRYASKLKESEDRLNTALAASNDLNAGGGPFADTMAALQAEYQAAQSQVSSTWAAYSTYRDINQTAFRWGLPVAAAACLMVALVLFASALVRGSARSLTRVAAAAGSLAAGALAIAVVITAQPDDPRSADAPTKAMAANDPGLGLDLGMEAGAPAMAQNRFADPMGDRAPALEKPADMMPPMAAPFGIPKPGVPVPAMGPGGPIAEHAMPERKGRGMPGAAGRRDLKGQEKEAMNRLAVDDAKAGFGGGRDFQNKAAGRPLGAAKAAIGPAPGIPAIPGAGAPPMRENGRIARQMAEAQPPAPPFVLREYAHVNSSAASGAADRNDRTETLLWQPALILDAEGKGKVTFQTSDEVTRFRVQAFGHTLDGRLGASISHIESRKPFSVEARLPIELSSTDVMDVPVVMTNDTDVVRPAKITVSGQNLTVGSSKSMEESLQLQPNAKVNRYIRMQPMTSDGIAYVEIDGRSEPFGADKVVRSIPVVPEGFPIHGSRSDLLEKVAGYEIELPADYIKGTLKLKAVLYPTTLADLQRSLDGLLREPHGCFEQTSSTNYPNTLVLQYLKETDQNNPQAMQRAAELLSRGYQRLTSFECQKPGGNEREGYEWFGGQAPPHEALTAYGLLQFKDMAQVSAVDEEMVLRTRQYLLNRRRPDGTFDRNSRAIDTFGRAPEHITNAYIVWALTETGRDDLTKEIDVLLKQPEGADDPYFLSLMANSLINANRRDQAIELLKKVAKKQQADGAITGATTSITSSGGRDLAIETTALAVLAWLKANNPVEFTEPLAKAVKWIGGQRSGLGGFGSTQSTVMALKALIAHTKANKVPGEAGSFKMYINGKLAGFQDFRADAQEALTIELPDAEQWVAAGKNQVELRLSTNRAYPATLGWSYHSRKPASDDACAVRLETTLNKSEVRQGDSVRLTATLRNTGGANKGQPMTVAIIGLPAGLKVPEDMKQLKDLAALKRTGPNGEVEAGDISFFEIRGRDLVLYWRDLKPQAQITVAVDLIAHVPGEYRGSASRAYLYYNADSKHWIDPLSIVVKPAAEAP